MARSAATTVDDYLATLPPAQQGEIAAVRDVIRQRLPRGYQERMNWGMISYEIPLDNYPNTYNGQPLGYAGLAAQKNHCALYLMSVYMNPSAQKQLRDAFAAAGKKLDMGKSCIRFKAAEELPLDAIGDLVAAVPPRKWIEIFEKSRRR